MQNAVKIVPILTKALILSADPPPSKYNPIPIAIQRKSEEIRTCWNLPSFHFSEQTSAIASYVETPISAIMYREDPKQRAIKPQEKAIIRMPIVGVGKSRNIMFCENSTT